MTADLPPDRDELIALINRALAISWGMPEQPLDPDAPLVADAILGSSWLVGVVEAAKREALTEAADELITWGSRTSVKDWLRARAGVGAVPQTTEGCGFMGTYAEHRAMGCCPVGAPLVGEGPQ